MSGENPFFDDEDDIDEYGLEGSQVINSKDSKASKKKPLDDPLAYLGDDEYEELGAPETEVDSLALPTIDLNYVSSRSVQMPPMDYFNDDAEDYDSVESLEEAIEADQHEGDRVEPVTRSTPVVPNDFYNNADKVLVEEENGEIEIVDEPGVEPEDNSISTSVDDLLSQFASGENLVSNEAPSYRGSDAAFDLDSAYEDEDEDDEASEEDNAGFILDEVVSEAIRLGASDIHINAYDYVSFTKLGSIIREERFGIVSPQTTLRLEHTIISNVLDDEFVQELELDTSYVVKTGPHRGRRLRLSIGKSEGNIYMVFRVIADSIPSPVELGLEQTLRNWAKLPNGLFMINGPTGTGKSTTLASLIQEIQYTRAHKVISIEKPIEFIYGNKGLALITQREVGSDTRSFAGALTSAMRQNPDIILVGEVRDRLEIDELLRAAETGHLAISTMHTNSAAETINRIRSLYEGDEQLRILSTLSQQLRGLANQVLLKTKDGKARFAVREVLSVDREVSRLINLGDTNGIRNYQEDKKQTLEHELVKAVKTGKVTELEARGATSNVFYFDELMGK